MKNLIFIVFALFAFVFSSVNNSLAAESVPVKSGRATVQLVTSHDQIAPDDTDTAYIALSFRLDPHWHTYWRNAGGPGNPVNINWQKPDGVEIGEIIWPLPKLVRTGPIVNYAFEDRLVLAMPMTISDNFKPGDEIIIKAKAMYLVCYQVCLPEMANLEIKFKVGKSIKDSRWAAAIAREIKKAPKPASENMELKAGANIKNEALIIDIKAKNIDFSAIKNPYFFPYEQDIINADIDQKFATSTQGISFSLAKGFKLEAGLKDIEGVLAFEKNGKRQGIELIAKAGANIDTGVKTIQSPTKTSATISGLLLAMIGAFIGGLILNLMPCVFPVLSLKALGFAKAAHEDKAKIRTHGWLYTLGVMLTFLLLAVLVMVLKAMGAAIGWGFQLQNPIIIGALAVLFFIIALNLFGLFHIGGKVQNIGSDLASKNGNKGAFFTGVLAVIVASPCTAPFMAGALGFAFAAGTITTLAIFVALGFGFALPFLALAHSPGLLKLLPKPGAWMTGFKQFMAFPMLGASIWLIWVLASQTGAGGVLRILSALLAIGFAIWLLRYKSVLSKILLLLSILFAGWAVMDLGTAQFGQKIEAKKQAGVWSHENIRSLRADGYNVFVDFTAAWCVSCKVNDRLVLSRAKTKALFERTNTKMLVADWTNHDEAIAKELEKFGRSGVPLYLLYPAGTDETEPLVLPQILSYSILEKAISEVQADAKK